MSVSEPLLLCKRKPTSIVGYWNLLYVIGSSSKFSNHFIISCCIGWDNHYYYWYCILCSIIIWEDHKVVVEISQGQPSYSYLYYIVNSFYLMRIYCVNIHCQELEIVGVRYCWGDLRVVVYTKSQPSTSHVVIHKWNHLRQVPKLLEPKEYLSTGW